MAMKRWALATAVGWFIAGWVCAESPRIDRNIRKEPAYHSKPQYFLLGFGPEAKKHVWVVLDGEDYYVDRNGNGDLTEVGEHVRFPAEVEIEGDGKVPVTLNIGRPNQEGRLVCDAFVQGRYIQ
jgi:hypothetical protein